MAPAPIHLYPDLEYSTDSTWRINLEKNNLMSMAQMLKEHLLNSLVTDGAGCFVVTGIKFPKHESDNYTYIDLSISGIN